MSKLSVHLENYLKLRRQLGFKLAMPGHLLPNFVRFAERQRASFITSKLALRWATQPANIIPAQRANRLGMVRRFAEYLSAIDPRTEIPPQKLLPYQFRRQTPYLYRDEGVLRLIAAARRINPSNELKGTIYATLFGLLAVTGMRVGEALGLDREDVDLKHALLTIRRAKGNKSRFVPLHPSTEHALRRFVAIRDRAFPDPIAPFRFGQRVEVEQRLPLRLPGPIGCHARVPPDAVLMNVVLPDVVDAFTSEFRKRDAVLGSEDGQRFLAIGLVARIGFEPRSRLGILLLDPRKRVAIVNVFQPNVGIVRVLRYTVTGLIAHRLGLISIHVRARSKGEDQPRHSQSRNLHCGPANCPFFAIMDSYLRGRMPSPPIAATLHRRVTIQARPCRSKRQSYSAPRGARLGLSSPCAPAHETNGPRRRTTRAGRACRGA